ncbi:hypothetical protein BH23CHL7_BH23CHL7_06620 [soil metagenome]
MGYWRVFDMAAVLAEFAEGGVPAGICVCMKHSNLDAGLRYRMGPLPQRDGDTRTVQSPLVVVNETQAHLLRV